MTLPLRVVIQSVSSLFATLLQRGLDLHPEVHVIATGVLASPDSPIDRSISSAADAAPHVLILDFDVDRAADLQAALAARSRMTCPILVLAPQVTPENTARMRARGFPVVRRRPDLNQLTDEHRVDPLYQLLRATVRGAGAPAPTDTVESPRGNRPPDRSGRHQQAATPPDSEGPPAQQLVVIGASTGGPPAVREVLRAIPNDGDWAIAIVQHITPSFAAGFARWIDESTHHRARLAEHQMPVTAGAVVVAPGDTHLRIRGGRYALDGGEKRLFQRPSANNLFESAAAAFGPNTVGVLLTGMGHDGGEGCCAIVTAGGVTVVQDQESSTVYGMPRAAAELGCVSQQLPLTKIGDAVRTILQERVRRGSRR
ncbi:MAG: CheB methylesterase domain-containing protein [Alkalispirochaeta sp.]